MYEKVIAYYGEEAQCRQAMEECAELIQAVNKIIRFPAVESKNRLTEEIADVLIMIEQLKEIYNISDTDIHMFKMYKDNRLFKRLEAVKRG